MYLGVLTDINESSWRALAKLLGLVGQGDFHYAGYVPGRRLYPNRVRRDQLSNKSKNNQGEFYITI